MIFVDVKPLEMQDWLIFISESHTGHLHLDSLSTGRHILACHIFFFFSEEEEIILQMY